MLRGHLPTGGAGNEGSIDVSEHDQEIILTITYPIRENMASLGSAILLRTYAHDVSVAGNGNGGGGGGGGGEDGGGKRRFSHEKYLEAAVYIAATTVM